MNGMNDGNAGEVNGAPGAVFLAGSDCRSVVGPGGVFLRINEKWGEVFGYSCRKLHRKRFLVDIPELVDPEDTIATFRAIEELGGENEAVRFRAWVRCSDGAHRHFDWCAQQREDLIYVLAKMLDQRPKKKRDADLRIEPVQIWSGRPPWDVIASIINGVGREIAEN